MALAVIMMLHTWNLPLDAITWTSSTPLPQDIQDAACGTNKDHSLMYIIGGGTNNGALKTIYQFDGEQYKLLNQSLSAELLYNEEVPGQFNTVIDDVIYFVYKNFQIGGFNATSTTILQNNVSLPIQNYNCMTCLTSNNTHLFYLNTINNDCANMAIWTYNIKSQQWLNKNGTIIKISMNYDGSAGHCIYYNRSIYIFLSASNAIGKYDFQTNRISNAGQMGDFSMGRMIIMPHNDGTVYIIGGRSLQYDESHETVYIFYANTQGTSLSSYLNRPKSIGTVGYMNERIYVMGGQNKNTSVSSNLTSVPPTYSPTHSPTHSPSHSPSDAPTPPTNAPTVKELLFATEKQMIYYGIGIGTLMVLCCVAIRCCYRHRNNAQGNIEDSISDESAGERVLAK